MFDACCCDFYDSLVDKNYLPNRGCFRQCYLFLVTTCMLQIAS